MPKRARFLLAVLGTLNVLGAPLVSFGQSSPALVRLSLPTLTIGSPDVQFHRVSGAGVFADGGIAVADAGNHRVLVFSTSGQLLKSFGRQGSAPAEFQTMTMFAVQRDTILVYDQQQAKVVVFDRYGVFARSTSLADVGGRVVLLRAFQSPSQYIVSTQVLYGAASPTGMYGDTTDVGLFDASRRTIRPITRVEWRRVFHHRAARGTTTYGAPFIGETALAATRAGVTVIPLGRQRAEVYGTTGARVGASAVLPVRARSVDRTMVNAFRDSLLLAMRSSSARFPGAVERVEESFGAAFPVPQSAAAILRAQVVGDHVWLEEFPTAASVASRWLLFDPQHRVVVGTITIPQAQQVLGGDARSVLLLVSDGDGVQSVVRHEVLR